MLIVPLQAVPNQTVNIQLAGQNCNINVYQKSTGLFFDLYVGNVLVIAGVICQNLNRIVRSLYLGFIGDFWFADTQGSDDPISTGLGARFELQYIEASDLPAGAG
jgi:hypothetical protein